MHGTMFTTNGFHKRKFDSVVLVPENAQMMRLMAEGRRQVDERRLLKKKNTILSTSSQATQLVKLSRTRSTMAPSSTNVRNVVGGKAIVSLLQPQLDLYDGLYAGKKTESVVAAASKHAIDAEAYSIDSLSEGSQGDGEVEEHTVAPVKAGESPQLSCCSSDLSEFEKLKLAEK